MDIKENQPRILANERIYINGLVEEIVGACFDVSNELGAGFLEKVYENALVIELQDRSLEVVPQVSIPVIYKERSVGQYYADLIVENKVLIEVKCVKKNLRNV